MHLIVGLGNPGEKYKQHRHNIGALWVDMLAEFYRFPPFSAKYNGLFTKARITINNAQSYEVALLKPQTYMNKSGISVVSAAKFYNIPPSHIWVAHDELDIACGAVKFKHGGGHGGHNGLRDIDRHIGKDYGRIRIGIDHPGHKDAVHGYVLGTIGKSEWQRQEPKMDGIIRYLNLLLSNETAKLSNELSQID